MNGLSASARFPGFADALGDAIADLEAGLLGPEEVDGDLALLYASYRSELERLGLWDADLERAERPTSSRASSLPGAERPCSSMASRI